MYCAGELDAAFDILGLWKVASGPGGLNFCIDNLANVTPLQKARIMVKWLEGHPERLHERDTYLIVSALVDAFPCSKSK